MRLSYGALVPPTSYKYNTKIILNFPKIVGIEYQFHFPNNYTIKIITVIIFNNILES
jgi:hypothetical protein